ncbi:hypothetical protein DPMN_169634 [Dreissena polymorpha]|uniref:Uncharacterized protein n=1 Tax=Dreissena polymorpha TaxID=45954 RepID=A0A9D4DY98_DREPO|nr:hypothetical protein DPMN_169634 [Dreissena polymorpha]
MQSVCGCWTGNVLITWSHKWSDNSVKVFTRFSDSPAGLIKYGSAEGSSLCFMMKNSSSGCSVSFFAKTVSDLDESNLKYWFFM